MRSPFHWSPRAIGLLAAVVTVLVWTAFIVIARASAQRSLHPFDIALCRIVGASLVLLPWGWWLVRRGRRAGAGGARAAGARGRPKRGTTPGPSEAQDPPALGGREAHAVVSGGASWLGVSPLSRRVTVSVGLFGGLGYAMLAYSGFFFAPAAHASVLMPGSLPLWTALLAALVLGDRITPFRALGLALIVGGDLLVGGASLLRAFDGGEVWKGDLLFMSAAACWAVYSVLARRHGLDAVRGTIAITVFAFVSFVPAYALLSWLGLSPSRLAAAPWGEILFQVLFQGLGSVVVSGIAFTRMIQHYGPVRSTMITALVPGLSALGAVVFLGEPLSWNLWAGLGLVTAGILFGVQAVRQTQPGGGTVQDQAQAAPAAAPALAGAAAIGAKIDDT